MRYEDINLIQPIEDEKYSEKSDFVILKMREILEECMDRGNNKVILNTNLKRGLPLENINKLAGPMIEAWASEIYLDILETLGDKFKLVNVEPQYRLGMADILLEFDYNSESVMGNVDVKASSAGIKKSGLKPNITSYSRIRTAYVRNPNYMFIILSLKQEVTSIKNEVTGLMDGVMTVVDFNIYDLKYISYSDLNYNPALGTGQIQIKDIHKVHLQKRTALEFISLLDEKYLRSSRRSIEDFIREAEKNKWITAKK